MILEKHLSPQMDSSVSVLNTNFVSHFLSFTQISCSFEIRKVLKICWKSVGDVQFQFQLILSNWQHSDRFRVRACKLLLIVKVHKCWLKIVLIYFFSEKSWFEETNLLLHQDSCSLMHYSVLKTKRNKILNLKLFFPLDLVDLQIYLISPGFSRSTDISDITWV